MKLISASFLQTKNECRVKLCYLLEVIPVTECVWLTKKRGARMICAWKHFFRLDFLRSAAATFYQEKVEALEVLNHAPAKYSYYWLTQFVSEDTKKGNARCASFFNSLT